MKLLTAPYGAYNYGAVSVRLTVDGAWSRDVVESVLLGHSCYPRAIPKILDCLHYSGRYDCWMTRSTAREVIERGALARAGIRFDVSLVT